MPWAPGEPPHEVAEAWRIRVLDGFDVRRTTDSSDSTFAYASSQQTEDFPDGGSARIEVAQLGADGEPGSWAGIDVEIPG